MEFEFGTIGDQPPGNEQKAVFEALGFKEPAFGAILSGREELGAVLGAGGFRALCVAPVYRRAVLPFCAELSPRAQALGADLLLRRADGTLFGENTGPDGVAAMAKKAGISFSGKKVLIFGEKSERANAARYAVRELGGELMPQEAEHRGEIAETAQILINASPAGSFPHSEQAPADLAAYKNCEGVLDFVSRPLRTRLLEQAAALKIPFAGGLWMLAGSCLRAAELAYGNGFPDAKLRETVALLQKRRRNILLIGMPGCGKTGLGKKVARFTGRPFYDIDAQIEKKAGKTIPEIFSQADEGTFRALEEEILREYTAKSGAVIATSGGAILREENRRNLRQNSIVILIDRDPGLLATRGRPLSSGKSAIAKLVQQRRTLYLKTSDVIVKNNGEFFAAVHKILEAAERTFEC